MNKVRETYFVKGINMPIYELDNRKIMIYSDLLSQYVDFEKAKTLPDLQLFIGEIEQAIYGTQL
jgi:hypothetical protein